MSDSYVHVVPHSLIEHNLAILRNCRTKIQDARSAINIIGLIVGTEALQNLPLRKSFVQGRLERAEVRKLKGKPPCFVSITRAGNLYLPAMLSLVPDAAIGYIDMHRDPKTHKPVLEGKPKLPPDIAERIVIQLDPLLATGHSCSVGIGVIREEGVPQENIISMNMVGGREGIARVREDHPLVNMFMAVIDPRMNEHKYLLPGVGDIGDIGHGTEAQVRKKRGSVRQARR